MAFLRPRTKLPALERALLGAAGKLCPFSQRADLESCGTAAEVRALENSPGFGRTNRWFCEQLAAKALLTQDAEACAAVALLPGVPPRIRTELLLLNAQATKRTAPLVLSLAALSLPDTFALEGPLLDLDAAAVTAAVAVRSPFLALRGSPPTNARGRSEWRLRLIRMEAALVHSVDADRAWTLLASGQYELAWTATAAKQFVFLETRHPKLAQQARDDVVRFVLNPTLKLEQKPPFSLCSMQKSGDLRVLCVRNALKLNLYRFHYDHHASDRDIPASSDIIAREPLAPVPLDGSVLHAE